MGLPQFSLEASVLQLSLWELHFIVRPAVQILSNVRYEAAGVSWAELSVLWQEGLDSALLNSA